MKNLLALLLCFLLVLTVCSCGRDVAPVCDFEYDISDFDFFSDIFDNNTDTNWEEMGSYTILINGLDTPVIFTMDGMNVVSVTAYGKECDVNIASFQGSSPVGIDGIKNAVIINETLDYSGRSWIFTADNVHAFIPDGDISTQVFANEDGTLRYTRYWGEYMTSFDQWDLAPLDLCDSRDEFLYENGAVKIENGKVELTPTKTVCVSDEFDLDAMFEEAKEDGMYENFGTVDELFASNAKSE